jgi:hypothetical protein
MKRIATLLASLAMTLAVTAAQSRPDSIPTDDRNGFAVTLPAGTRVELALTAPIWSKTAKAGDPLHAQSDFPVTSGSRIAIPPGTFVQGRILSISRPTRRSGRAQIQILFTTMIFANGFVVALPVALPGMDAIQSANNDPPTAVTVNVEVSQANDLLLDNGAQIEMTLAAPVSLDARQIAKAVALSRAPEPGKFKSATLCRPTPGSPGTSGTPNVVIPGSSGTPDITIPGGPGMPSTTIPGIPATPPTVIPGMPGTAGFPGTVCPAQPIVVSSVPLVFKPDQAQAAAPPGRP